MKKTDYKKSHETVPLNNFTLNNSDHFGEYCFGEPWHTPSPSKPTRGMPKKEVKTSLKDLYFKVPYNKVLIFVLFYQYQRLP